MIYKTSRFIVRRIGKRVVVEPLFGTVTLMEATLAVFEFLQMEDHQMVEIPDKGEA